MYVAHVHRRGVDKCLRVPLDVVSNRECFAQGFDYTTGSYDKWHAEAPNIPSISSETASSLSDRGEYMDNATTGHVSGYDTHAAGQRPEVLQ